MMRTRRASFIPVAPRAVRTFNAHKYPFIRDVRHSSTARDPSAQHCPRKLKGVPRGFRFGAANHSRHSPFCAPRKLRDFYFYRTPNNGVQTRWPFLPFSSVRSIGRCSSFLNYLFAEPICPRSISLGFICTNGLNSPLSSRCVARGREVNRVLRGRTFNPARRLEKF